MEIIICSSLQFIDKMKEIGDILTQKGHKVFSSINYPDIDYVIDTIKNDKEKYIAEIKGEKMKDYFNRIKNADAVLVLNYDKNGVKNYIGGNVLGEILIAFYFNKKIFLLNPMPNTSVYDEVKSVKPIILNGNLDLIGE